VETGDLTIGSKLGEEMLFNPFMRCTYHGEFLSVKHAEHYKNLTKLPDDQQTQFDYFKKILEFRKEFRAAGHQK
jgi:hypothetical protein